MSAKTTKAEIYISEDGGPERLSEIVQLPEGSADDAANYLRKHPHMDAAVILRVFAANWPAITAW